MKNRLADLNNHLYAQLERLSDESITPEKLKEETARAQAVAGVARQIIDTGRLAISAQKAMTDGLIRSIPGVLELEPPK